MNGFNLEQRVAALEQKVNQLEQAVANGSRPKDWREAAGFFAGDQAMKEIFAEALKYREADRKRARRKYSTKRRSKR